MIVVFNESLDSILFCIRAKEPYNGLYNFVGGKVEDGETIRQMQVYLKKGTRIDKY